MRRTADHGHPGIVMSLSNGIPGAILAMALALAGCSPPPAPPMYSITLRVLSDGHPMPGASVAYHDHVLGATDGTGLFSMRTTGTEGAAIPLSVHCPEGFTSPTQPVTVTLRSIEVLSHGQASSGIETTTECPPTQRIAAVILKAPNRANLPVMYNGREITRTDPQGIAHMIFRVAPGDLLTFQLRTTDQPLLRPESPMLTLTAHPTDDVYVLSQNFELATAARVHRAHVAPRGPFPMRIRPSHNGGGGIF